MTTVATSRGELKWPAKCHRRQHFWDCSRLRATKTATKAPRWSRAQEQAEASPAALRNRVWAACSVTWVERARRAAWEVFWAALLVNCSNDSSRAVRERLLSRGSMTAPTRRLLHLNSNRRLGRMSWQPWRSKPAFRRTSFSPVFRANCRPPATNTRPTAGFPVRTLKPLNHRGTRDGHHLDDHHRVYRGRYRQVYHAGTQ